MERITAPSLDAKIAVSLDTGEIRAVAIVDGDQSIDESKQEIGIMEQFMNLS